MRSPAGIAGRGVAGPRAAATRLSRVAAAAVLLPFVLLYRFGPAATTAPALRRHRPVCYYVSPAGDDRQPGTSDRLALATLQAAADRVRAGDTVIVRPGTYARGFVLNWDAERRVSGTQAAPIRFLADPGAVVTGRNLRTEDGIDIEPGCDWLTIQGFTINNARGTIARCGIRLTTAAHDRIVGNIVSDAGGFAIFTSFTTDLLIEGNTAAHTRREHGIYISNSPVNTVVRQNRVYANGGGIANAANSQGCGIQFNGDASRGGSGVARGALIADNVVYDNATNGMNFDGLQDARIENNVIYGNGGNGMSFYRVDAAQPSCRNRVVNNTIVVPAVGRYGIVIRDSATGTVVYNNILYNANPRTGAICIAADSARGFVSNYNLASGRFSADDDRTLLNLQAWRSGMGQDRQSTAIGDVKTLFVNAIKGDYHLAAASPAIAAGAAPAADVGAPPEDCDHRRRPADRRADAGAYTR